MRDVGCIGNSSRGLIKVEGPWGQEDLYSSRIYSRRRLREGSLFTRDGRSEPE
jgi:hypothetical protein